MRWQRSGSALFFGLAACLTWTVAPVVADVPEPLDGRGPCCSVSHCYGDSLFGAYVCNYTMESDEEYASLTITGPECTFDTQGYTLRVLGTLTNHGTITDNSPGGAGGPAGTGGLGGNPGGTGVDPTGCGRIYVNCTDGAPGEPGSPSPGPRGDGGDGGGGGGGAGGAWRNAGGDADGGNGAQGGRGGDGGGYVLIYAYNFDNQGLIHADGHDGWDGDDAPAGDCTHAAGYENCGGEYYEGLLFDIAGGGGGGGAGGDGGEGGTVEIHYAHLLSLGELRAAGGHGGYGGWGGSPGGPLGTDCTLDKGAGLLGGGHQDGCEGAGCAGDGGDGEHRKDYSAEPGTNGCDGQDGDDGAGILIRDCNCNELADDDDITTGTSGDCQPNGIPDECDLDRDTSEDCNVNLVPDECEALADCQPNGIPDVCELLFTDQSAELTPIGHNSPQSHTVPHPPEAVSNVTLLFTAVADLDFTSEFIDVYINGQHVGAIFESDAGQCSAIHDVATLAIPAEDFNNVVNGGNAVIDMVASTAVNPNLCDPYSCITVTVTYTTQRGDCNWNLVPDECDIEEGTSPDCQPNTVPDECDLALDGTSKYETETLAPFNGDSPVDVLLWAPAIATGDVSVIAWASADLDASSEYVDVFLDGDLVGQLFYDGYRQCPSGEDVDSVIISEATFNGVLPDGVTITLAPTADVNYCPGSVRVRVIYPAGSRNCNSNGIPDECDIWGGTSHDCNTNGVPDECEFEGCHFPTRLSENTTGYQDSCFVGPPDDYYYGIGGQVVTYEFDCGFVKGGPGPDFNVYEFDQGGVEFDKIDVLVSANGVDFVSVKSSEGAVVRIPGDEACSTNGFARSYDLSVASMPFVRYIRIDGNGSGSAGPVADFDLDAIGAIHTLGLDCNSNGIADICDIAAGTSQDTNGNGIPDECEIRIISVKSCQEHYGCNPPEEFCLDIGTGETGPPYDNIEPRMQMGVPVELEATCSGNVNAATVSVTCTPTSYGGTATVVADGTAVVRVRFSQVLPDQAKPACCMLTFAGDIVDCWTIVMLEGDVNLDCMVSTADCSSIKQRLGDPVDESNFWYDINRDCTISTADLSSCKARFGNLAPCPCVCP